MRLTSILKMRGSQGRKQNACFSKINFKHFLIMDDNKTEDKTCLPS